MRSLILTLNKKGNGLESLAIRHHPILDSNLKIEKMENIKKVFLGGTCNGSTWREKLIPMLKKDFFNPVVKDWTPECQEEERRQKSFVCDAQLYVITPKMIGVFSIAEVTDASNKTPDSTILCILKEDDEDDSFNNGTIKSLEAVKNLVKSNGAHVFNSLEEVAMFINNN